MKIDEIVSLIASCISIFTLVPMAIAFVVWLRNLTCKKTINPLITLQQPQVVSGHGELIANIDISFRNLSNRTFYISDIYISDNGKRIELWERLQAYSNKYATHYPLKVEPYQPITLLCATFTKYGFTFPQQIMLCIEIGKHKYNYCITPTIVPPKNPK